MTVPHLPAATGSRPLASRTPTSTVMLALLCLLVGALTVPRHAEAQSQTFFVPMTAEHIRDWADVIQNLPENDTVHTVISITATTDETVIYYDHWEDGFEPDITLPLDPFPSGTTEIWGDRDCSNGFTPTLGSCFADADDVVDAGDILILEADVPADPRDPTQIFADPSDKIATTQRITMTAAGWPSTGVQSQLGGALEIFPTSDWGLSYRAPVGEDIGSQIPAATTAFEYVAFEITAQEDGTQLEIDTDADGAIDLALTLDEGQVEQITGVAVGATVDVVAGAPVQAHLLTGNENSNYEGRWYSLVPTADWDTSYYSPVGATASDGQTHIYLHNPNASSITIRAEQRSGCANVTVPAGETREVQLNITTPTSAARFLSDGTNCGGGSVPSGMFFAVGAIDRGDIAYDWGFTLIPRRRLTPSAVVGWAPGSISPTVNSSPVWVTAVEPAGGSTTLYVDLDADPSTGSLTDPVGNLYDLSFTADDLESVRVYDLAAGGCGGGDCDQTGMRIYTVDGTQITAAWGQDPDAASPGLPHLDMGTTVLPSASLASFKDGSLLTDLNNNGGVDIGDTLLYTIRIVNTGIIPIDPADISVIDTLDPGTDYVEGSTQTDGAALPDDDLLLGGDTLFPLDADPSRPDGYTLQPPPATLEPGSEIVLTFQVVVNASAVDPIVNQVAVTNGEETFADSSVAPLPGAALEIVKTSNAGGDVSPGQTLTYTIDVTNNSNGAVTGVQLIDALPTGTTYVAESTSVTGPRQIFAADRFRIARLDNNNGPSDFLGDWNETDGGTDSAVTGDVQLILGELNITDVAGNPVASVARSVDLSEVAGGPSPFATLRFDYRYTEGIDTTDALVIEAATSPAGPFTVLETFTDLDGDVDPFTSGRRGYDISPFISAQTTIRFRVTNLYRGGDEFFIVDDLEIRAVGDGEVVAEDDLTSLDYSGGTGWAGPWVENDLTATPAQDPTAGDVLVTGGDFLALTAQGAGSSSPNSAQRSVDLSGRVTALLRMTYATTADVDATDFIDIEASASASGPFSLLDPIDGAQTSLATRTYDLTPYISSTTTIRLRIDQFYGGSNEFFGLDEIEVLAGAQVATTKNNVPGGGDDLVDGSPSLVVLPGDSFALAPGESLSASFQVLIDDPLALTRITNTATVTTHEQTPPGISTVSDPVSTGGTIGDRVWLDVDGDGVQDIGEPGLSGVTVELRDGVCTPAIDCPTVTTDGDGRYLFDRLSPGTYTVAADTSTLPGGGVGLALSPGLANPSASAVVTAEEVFLDRDFGFVSSSPTAGVLGDFVWHDTDGDGVQDGGEIGLGGVVVDLVGAGADGVLGTADDAQVATTTTASDGSYLFTGVAPGDYFVRLDGSNFGGGGALAGLSATSGPQSAGGATSAPVAVTGGAVLTDLDFGYVDPGRFSLSDVIWLDRDSDGTRDLNEEGIAGVTVDLYDNGGNFLGTAISAADGSIQWSGLESGDYTLVVTDNAGVLTRFEGTTAPALAAQQSATIAGADASNVSFGYAAPGVVGDTVWSDADGDGVQDPGEPGIAGVTVDLQFFNPATLTWDVVGTTTTAADGTYRFENLGRGSFRAVVTDTGGVLAGFTQTGDPTISGGPCAAACDATGQALVDLSTVDLSLDFGYQNAARPDVSGTVFEDTDRDGVEDAGEIGLAGVEIALVAAGPDGVFGTSDDLVVASTVTDGAGDYLFSDVPAGDYRVEVRDGADGSSSVLDGYSLTSGLDALPITVAAADLTDLDFGYARGGGTASIGDVLWIDVDPPGPDGPDGLPGPNEPRLPGVGVDLYLDLDGDGVFEPGGDDGAPIATTVTDAEGGYLFDDLPAGRYFVDVDETTLPTDLVETTYPVGVDPSAVIALADGVRVDDADFGYRPAPGTAILGDFVWYDADGDGLQDPGEAGIGGVTLELFGAGPDGDFGTGDDTSFTTTTAADGSYLFTGLAPDDYFMSFDATSLPAGVVTAPTNLPPGETTYQVTAAAGDVFGQLDFGFDGGTFGSIGDRVWLDQDGDGVQDAGESGLENVTVNLLGPGGNGVFGDADDEILATTTTGTDGAFDFVGLPAGDYRVDVTDLGGILDGLSLSGGSDPTATIALTSGQDFDGADFGYAPAAGTGSIGSTVWHDLDFDGVLDAGEPPLQGVTVDVWLDVDGDGVITPGVDNRVRRAVTDTNGAYEVKALPFGDYLVSVSDTAGLLSGFTPTVGPSPGTDGNSQSGPYAVTLSPGNPTDRTADFGYREAPGGDVLSITGTVFLDDDVDGVHDEPLEGVVDRVEVLLYRIVDGTPLLVGRTRTDVDGDYAFDDLPPGDYELHVDTTATGADGFLQTTQTTTGGIQPVTLAGVDSTGNDFGFFDGGITTTPVTLSFLHAEIVGSSLASASLAVHWQTVTEVGHVGFHVWLWQDGAWRRVDDGLVASTGGDSLSLRDYRRTFALDAAPAPGAQLMLEDVDIFGRSRFHGPFPLDRELGRRDVVGEPIDWRSIRTASERLARQRLDALRQESLAAGAGEIAARLVVRDDPQDRGVHRVTYEQLASAGVDFAGVPASSLALTRRGVPVPIHVGGVVDTFGPGGFVDFLGDGIDSLATRDAVYRLAVDPATARRMTVDAATATTASAPSSHRHVARFERERQYSFAAPNGDPWFDTALLSSGAPAAASFPFTLDRWDGTDPVHLVVDLWGVTDFARAPDHHVTLRLNGAVVADERFDGLVARTIDVEVPAALLTGGVETLDITVPGDTGNAFDLVHVDGFTVDYPRRFEAVGGELAFTGAARAFEVDGLPAAEVAVYRITGGVVERLTGVTVTADGGGFTARFPGAGAASASYRLATPAALRSPLVEPARPPVDLLDRDARLLIVAHADFVDGIERLADRRRSEGWTVRVVDLADVYTAYSGGIVDPQALREFLADAARTISTEAVLLVGGDTYDPLDHLGLGAVAFVPSLYAQTGDLVRFAPSDGLYADVDGDEVPDLAIGRFPVRTTSELETMIDKTLDYEALAGRRSLVLAADGYDAPSRFDFTVASEQLARRLPVDWTLERVLLDQQPVTDARPQLLEALDDGPALTSFMGHSGPTTWTFDGLFSAADAAGLANAGRPTVVNQWGCWTTYYVSPEAETLAHELLLAGDRGAAAVLGATTLTEARSERALALEIYSRLFEPGATLGGAVRDAKRRLAALEDPAVLDVLLGWTLLGDPTLGGFDGVADTGVLFRDGFESGTTGAWSQAVPSP